MKTLAMRMEGTAPLLMNDAKTADPTSPWAKAIKQLTSKRNKTDDDYVLLARAEFEGGLYYNHSHKRVYVPGVNVERCLIAGGKLSRLGTKLQRGLFVPALEIPLIYSGPHDLEGLWANANFRFTTSVRVVKRVQRTRPIFQEWALEFEAQIDEGQLEIRELQRAAEDAGALIGLGDYRPRYGRFTVKTEEI